MWPKPGSMGKWLRLGNDSDVYLTDEIREFYGTQLGQLAFDLTLDDIERLSSHSRPVVLREGNEIVAACLLVQTDTERRLHAEHSNFNLKFDSSGTFITALRISKKINPEKAALTKRKLIGKSLRTSMALKGLFTGYIETDEDPLQLSPLQGLICYRARGSLYRVFHPEHTQLPSFSNGFLRPNHTPSFEWIFS
jgi:hypothetical protein